MYRCMNEKIVDANFKVELEGMSMAMKCTSGAGYITTAFVGTLATLATIALF